MRKIQTKITLPSLIYLSIVVLTSLEACWPISFFGVIITSLMIIFLVIEFPKASRIAQIMGATLGFIGIVAALSSDKVGVIGDGFSQAKIFLVMFFAVSWLQLPSRISPSLDAARKVITSQPPGKRFLIAALGVHGLGAVLNLAGLSLVASMINQAHNLNLKRRLTIALTLGFSSASSWSPFYISMVVVLLAIPSLNFWELLPFGLVFALGSIFTGWVYDRLTSLDANSAFPQMARVMNFRECARLGILLLGLVFLVMVTMDFFKVSIPIALGIIAPLFSMIWWEVITYSKNEIFGTGIRLGVETIAGLENLRSEVIIFVAATIFGVGLSSVGSEASISFILEEYITSVDVRIAVLTFSGIGLGMLGLHPVILVILVGESISPEALGVKDWIMGLSLLSIWGLSTMVNPFSGTNLYLAKVTSISPYTIAWSWNIPVVLLATGISTGILICLNNFWN